jgi:hypothetical protein
MRTGGAVTSGCPTEGPRPNTMFATPGGNRSPMSSKKRSEVSGVISEGYSTSVLPAASAGPIFQAAIISG